MTGMILSGVVWCCFVFICYRKSRIDGSIPFSTFSPFISRYPRVRNKIQGNRVYQILPCTDWIIILSALDVLYYPSTWEVSVSTSKIPDSCGQWFLRVPDFPHRCFQYSQRLPTFDSYLIIPSLLILSRVMMILHPWCLQSNGYDTPCPVCMRFLIARTSEFKPKLIISQNKAPECGTWTQLLALAKKLLKPVSAMDY